jgi:hypothetical protein
VHHRFLLSLALMGTPTSADIQIRVPALAHTLARHPCPFRIAFEAIPDPVPSGQRGSKEA